MANGFDDIEQNVKITYDTNANETAKEVDNLENSMDGVNDAQEKTIKTQKKVKKSTDATTKSNKGQKKGLEDLGGGIGGAIKGFKALLKTMWAVVANPIGLVLVAIVGALTLLFKAFTSTKEGAEKFDQIMDGISATIDVLRDRVLKIGSAIVKFFSGDFKGAVEAGREAVSGFGEEVAREFKIAADARKSLQEVADAMRELSVSRAELNRDLLEAKEIIESETASYKEKQKAIDDVRIAETKQTELELANAKKRLESIIAQNEQSNSSKEALQEEADARIAVINLEAESARNKTKFSKLQEQADIDEASRIKGLSDAKKAEEAAEEARFQAFLKRGKEREEIRLKEEEIKQKEAEQRQKDLEELQAFEDEQEQILIDAEDRRLENAAKAAKEEAAIEQAKLDQKKAVQDATFNLLFSGLGALKNIFSENKKIQKGILIAENATALAKLTMNTIEAVSKDNAASPLTFGLPWSGIHIAQGAIGAANIIASTASGLKALGGGSAGRAPNFGSPRGSASATPSVGFQSSSENQIATTIADNTNELPPQQAFVVSREMSTQQELDRNKVSSNSL